MKTFTVGDIHGANKALIQCIERSEIDKENDRLIFVGDIVDGWHEAPECVDTLLEFKNLIAIRGNHDQWFMEWADTRELIFTWYKQGGKATLDRYKGNEKLIVRHMEDYFKKTKIYYVDKERNYVFMHGGYNWHMPLEFSSDYDIMWDRHMVEVAQTWKYEKFDARGDLLKFREFDKIFIGHTTTQYSADRRYKPSLLPAFLSNLINMDTGAGWGSGKLTIMNIDTLEYWQSDPVDSLYPDIANSRK